ncbi:MAG: glycosyltransferase [Thermoanaerobaculia bacterium]
MSRDPAELRVAVVHDWLTGMRGGENVLQEILEIFPRSEVFTLFHFEGRVSPAIEAHPIHTSFLQRIASSGDYRRLLPLFPLGIRGWDLGGFDLIVSSSHCVAKSVKGNGIPHVCYCHTPMRYIWDRFDDYFPRRRPLLRAAAYVVAKVLRPWDVRTASRPDLFVANSGFVRDRIARIYHRDADVIHPFVDDEFFDSPIDRPRDEFDLVVSALVPYKKIELAVETASTLGRGLVVIGEGPMLPDLRRKGSDTVRFLGAVPRETLIDHLTRARSLILPGVEDFGITPLEAMACGTPVVAFGEGGVTESVIDGETGVFFDRPDVASLAGALDRLDRTVWDRERLRRRAAEFSRNRFRREFVELLEREGLLKR